MLDFPPSPSTILCGSRTTAGTIITIPAGGMWTGDITISAAITGLGVGQPSVTVTGTGAIPATGSIVAQCTVAGLLGIGTANSSYIEAVVYAPVGNSVDLVFGLGGASASVVINGHLF